jgi:hypothetical protein
MRLEKLDLTKAQREYAINYPQAKSSSFIVGWSANLKAANCGR